MKFPPFKKKKEEEKKVKLIGTGHIFNIREKVRKLIEEERPQAVCVELDEERYRNLLRRTFPADPLALLQALLAAFHGTIPGNDMLGAVEGAKSLNIPVFLIDRPIRETKERLIRAFACEFLNPLEVLRKLLVFPLYLISQFEMNKSPSSSSQNPFEDMVREFEKDPERYRRTLGLLFPIFKRALLDEREDYMAAKIKKILEEHAHIAAVVGAGHIPGLRERLSGIQIEIITLSEILNA